jgi:transcriptional regulator with XRE-family HTH domain
VDRHHKLRGERNAQGLTQVELGHRASVSPSTISHIECHRGPDVPREQLRPTKTKFSTAARLVNALMGPIVEEHNIPAGTYSIEELVALVNGNLVDKQQIFTLLEIYEIAQAGKPKRSKKNAPATKVRSPKRAAV